MTIPAPTASDPRDLDELALLSAGFPAFRLWRETTGDGPRYIAQGLSLATRPHTLVTSDLAELRTALTASRQNRSGAGTAIIYAGEDHETAIWYILAVPLERQ